MKYLCIADLHLDFWEDARIDVFEGLKEDIAALDLFLVAGDLTNKPQKRWTRFLERLVDMTGPGAVKVFPGKHDFYQYRIDSEHRLQEFADRADAEYVNREVFTLGGTRFICATLWTDFNLPPGRVQNDAHIPTRMNDYRAIRHAGGGYRRLRLSETIAIHYADLAYIAQALRVPFEGRSIVVTHHAPHPGVLRDYSENLEAAYASDLSFFIENHRPDGWMFGHSHDANSIAHAGCPIENVSLGYPGDVTDPAERIRSLVRSA